MSARLLSGRELAAEIRAEVAARAAALSARDVTATLAVVSATDDEGSAWYVRSLATAAGKAGIDAHVHDLGPTAESQAIVSTLQELASDAAVHGVILQTPLPPGAMLHELAEAIPPAKDVDGAGPLSAGRLMLARGPAGATGFAPATAEAVIALADHHGIALSGAHVVVVGRSNVVGKPLIHLLLQRDATVTVCHTKTADLIRTANAADVLVAAAGRAGLIDGRYVKRGAAVIDVGTNATPDGGLVGDVDAESVAGVAGALTPVPGGVGPVTTALLLRHVVEAAEATGAAGDVSLATRPTPRRS